jgi:hypothetical protein
VDSRQLVLDRPSCYAAVCCSIPVAGFPCAQIDSGISFCNLLPRTARDFPPLHRLSVSSNSCYFVIVALSTADESNATLKTVTGSVNNAGLDRRVQFVIPFPKADYHRNR